jgi:hypothetical protein
MYHAIAGANLTRLNKGFPPRKLRGPDNQALSELLLGHDKTPSEPGKRAPPSRFQGQAGRRR